MVSKSTVERDVLSRRGLKRVGNSLGQWEGLITRRKRYFGTKTETSAVQMQVLYTILEPK